MAVASAAQNEIAATRVFDAPRELVWRMWTDPKHVAHWWGPDGFTNTIHEMDVRPGGVWRFIMHGPDGTDYNNKFVYKEVVAPSRLAYAHVSGPIFDAVVDFIDRGAKTEVSVRMVFESAELRDKVVEQFGAVEGLHQTLGKLEAMLEETFVTSRTFDAPRDLVWKAWTETDRLMQWFGPKGTTMFHAKNDLRPGGIFHFALRTPDGGEMWGKWVYREIAPPERLVWVHSFSDAAGNITRHPMAPTWPAEMLTNTTFAEEGGRTTVTIEWRPLGASAEERATFIAGKPGMTQGWSGTFEQLTDYLARTA